MTNESLISWIEDLNNNTNYEKILLSKIGQVDSKEIYSAIIWDKEINWNEKVRDRNYAYFIKSKDKFVGVVYVMKNIFNRIVDLHSLVLKEHRKQGHLTTSLKDVILPHIFWKDGWEYILVSIDEEMIGDKNYKASRKVTESVGFIEIENNSHNKSTFKLISKDVKEYNFVKNETIFLEKKKDISNRLMKIHNEMNYVKDLIEQYHGNSDFVEDIEHYAKEIFEIQDSIKYETKNEDTLHNT